VIFVTVGTSEFDQLVERMDELAPFLDNQVVAQIGNGRYVLRNCEYFRFAPSLDPYYDKADIVVAHGGLGTTMEVLAKGKKLISVENTNCIDDHQTDILGFFAKEGYLIWCRDMDELPSLLERAPAMSLRPYVAPPCRIAEVVRDFLRKWE
jgi:beta-1,4-N-acetylglucosaminyltransferase